MHVTATVIRNGQPVSTESEPLVVIQDIDHNTHKDTFDYLASAYVGKTYGEFWFTMESSSGTFTGTPSLMNYTATILVDEHGVSHDVNNASVYKIQVHKIIH